MATKIHQEYLDESILPQIKKKKGKRSQGQKISFNFKDNAPIILYSIFGLILFFFFLFLKLPLDRLSGEVLQIASSQTQMDWQAKDMKISVLFGPKITFYDLTITAPYQTRNETGDTLSKIIGESFTIDKVSFKPNLWQLIPIPWLKESQPAGSFSLTLFQSEIEGSFVFSKKMLYLNIQSDHLDLKNIPGIQRLLTAEGKLENFELEITAPFQRLSMATGEINFHGDKLKIDIASLSSANFIKNIGLLNLGKIVVNSTIKNGSLLIKDFSLTGKNSDIEAKLEGDIKLNDRLEYSNLNLSLFLTVGAKLEPLMENPLLTSFIPFEKKPNNNYALKIQGALSQPNMSGLKTSP